MNTEEKINIIKEVGEEIIGEEELKGLLESNETIYAYDGFEPSGQIHIAQGILRSINVNKLTSAGIKFKFWVADWFGLLNNKMGGDLEKIKIVGEYFIEVWKASGMNMENVEFIWASDFIKSPPEYWETVLKLSMNATVNRVLRCGQIMGREENTSNPSAQILYPLMQAADIHHLGVHIAQLGLDQRKVNVLARELFPKIGFKKPIAVHHHMLLGLKHKESDSTGIDKKIDIKMSKSDPNTAIFMNDSTEDIKRKLNKAYCPEGVVEENPILEYCKYLVFEKFDKLVIERPEKWGGNLEFSSYDELEKGFLANEIHPADLKGAVAYYIDLMIKPVRDHFENDIDAKALFEKVKSFQITR